MIMHSSRRTIQSGEVVTFATEFERRESSLRVAYIAKGPFEVSASRDAVVVHNAVCESANDVALLLAAIRCAEAARVALEPTWRGGCQSMYLEEPTRVEQLSAKHLHDIEPFAD